MTLTLSLLPVLGLSLTLGVLVNRASSCGVAAVKHWRDHGSLDRILGLCLAAGGAAIAILVLGGISPQAPRPEPALPLGLIIVGAMIVGLGAVLNGACLLGSLSRLGDGEIRYFLVFPGLALGFWAAEELKPVFEHFINMAHATPAPPLASNARLALAVAAAGLVWLVWPWSRTEDGGPWRVRWSMPILGVVGGALFYLYPSWSYSDAIHKAVEWASHMMGASYSPIGLACILALALGATLSGMRRPSFAWRSIEFSSGLRSLTGAFCMGFGGALAGGGNDRLLFWSLPHLGLSALLAYGILTATIAVLVWRSPPKPPAPLPT